LKTININLLGEFGRLAKKNKPLRSGLEKDILNAETRRICILIIVGSLGIFAFSFLIWAVLFFSAQKMSSELVNMTQKCSELKFELESSETAEKNAKERKKILELKLLAKNQINQNIVSWEHILSDIVKVVPENIKITEINKVFSTKKDKEPLLNIKGQINPMLNGSLKHISYLVLNINENLPPSTLLKDAIISSVKFNENTKLYDFTVQAKIKTHGELEKQISKNHENKQKQVENPVIVPQNPEIKEKIIQIKPAEKTSPKKLDTKAKTEVKTNITTITAAAVTDTVKKMPIKTTVQENKNE
jgi:Tfp pilus assembly protein PilN